MPVLQLWLPVLCSSLSFFSFAVVHDRDIIVVPMLVDVIVAVGVALRC